MAKKLLNLQKIMKQYRITSKDIMGIGEIGVPDAILPPDDPAWDMITADSDAPSSIVKSIQDAQKGKE
jgi:hypothetical protein